MIRFLADEDFNGRIVRGLKLRIPEFGLVRVQDIGQSGGDDEKISEWAADHGRIVLTHDARTIPRYVTTRLREGAMTEGVFVVWMICVRLVIELRIYYSFQSVAKATSGAIKSTIYHLSRHARQRSLSRVHGTDHGRSAEGLEAGVGAVVGVLET